MTKLEDVIVKVQGAKDASTASEELREQCRHLLNPTTDKLNRRGDMLEASIQPCTEMTSRLIAIVRTHGARGFVVHHSP